MRRMYVLCLACAILAGCGLGSDTRQTSEASKQEPGNAREESSDAQVATTISVGDELSNALDALRGHGLQYEESNMDAASDPTLELRMYQVVPKYETPDALFLTATGKPEGNDFQIDDIYWWIDFEHDAERGKGERKNEERHVKTITLADLTTDQGPQTTDN